jgi:hypothetical protein
MKDVWGLVELVRSNMGDQHMGLAGARARLIAAIDEIKLATGAAIRQAIDGYPARLNAYLSPDNDNSPLSLVERGSTSSDYVASLADWLGVPESNEENTTKPIKREMMEGFKRVMEDVDRQLWREGGL